MSMDKNKIKQFFLFAYVGVLCTLLTMLGIFILNRHLVWNIFGSYVLMYFLTICLSYALNIYFVFKKKLSLEGLIGYIGIYISSLLLGTLLLFFFTILFSSINETWLSYATIPFTTIYNYLCVNHYSTKLLSRI